MLGKLIKYDMKALGRIFLPLYGALITITVINRILGMLGLTVPLTIGTVVYGAMIGATCVLTLVLTVTHFGKSFLGSEGYLTFTLPVSTDKLIISKVITALVWFFLSFISFVATVFIMSSAKVNLGEIMRGMNEFLANANISWLNASLFVLEGLMLFVFMLACFISLFYACISLGLLMPKRRKLFTIGAFIAIVIIWQIVAAEVAKIAMYFRPESFSVGTAHVCLGLAILGEVTAFLVFYFITRYMLKNKLNLE